MFPTSPLALARSMCSSCTTPCSSIATRVSCGVTLIRISLLISQNRKTEPRQKLGRLEQRQAHHSRVASLQVPDEGSRLALDRVAARFVERLARGDIALDLVLWNGAKGHPRRRDRERDLRFPAHCDGGDDVVRPVRQRGQHRHSGCRVRCLPDRYAVEHDLGVRGEHRPWRELAPAHPMPADRGLRPSDAFHVFNRSFVLARPHDDVAPSSCRLAQLQDLELDAELAQQFLPSLALRCEIDRRTFRQNEQFAHSRWYGCPPSRLAARNSCSARSTRARPCGNVSAERDIMTLASRLSSSARPSALPITKATSSALSRQSRSRSAKRAVVQGSPRSSSATV